MARQPVMPEVGRIVKIMRGRDSGKYAVVVSHSTGRFVYIADGASRKVETPKKKNSLHLQVVSRRVDELIQGEWPKVKLSNADLRHVMRSFTQHLQEAGEGNQEGAMQNG